jgi:hypothetical protein
MAKKRALVDTEPSIWIRFVGDDLAGRSVPVHDLSMTLLAAQRVIYKAHLFKTDRLSTSAAPTSKERINLALRLGERRRESDAYCLLGDPLFREIVAPLIVQGLTAIAAYAAAALRFKKKPKVPASISQNWLTIIIYPQVVSFTKRVDGAVGIREVEIYSQSRDFQTTITFDRDARTYVRSIGSQSFPGSPGVLVGRVKTLYYEEYSALVERETGPSVKVYLSEDDFDTIRREKDRLSIIEFHGTPLLRLGSETFDFKEFEATGVSM